MPDVLKNIDINILLKIIFVIVGIAVVFILAKVLAALVAKLIKKCTFIEKMFKKIDVKVNLKKVGKIVWKCVYFVLIACAIIGWLAYLNILSPNALGVLIDDYVLAFISAAVIALWAWILALLAKIWITKVLKTTDIDEKIWAGEKSDSTISESLAVVWFWGVILYFIPYVLAELGQDELLSPITGIINEITSFIPQLVWAGVIVAIAYFVGKFVAKIVTELLSGLGFDKVLWLVWIQNNNSTTSP